MLSKYTAASLTDPDAKAKTPFAGATTKVSILSLDDTELGVTAQYNPKELQLDRSVSWRESSPVANIDRHEEMHLEHTGTPTRAASLELTFDCVEHPTEWRRFVGVHLDTLEKLATPIDPTSRDEQKRRPHHCVVSWGPSLPRFTCVIESVSIKILMFAPNGAPLRATATVKLKEAHAVKKEDRKVPKPLPTR